MMGVRIDTEPVFWESDTIMDDRLAYHSHLVCYRLEDARILALHSPGARNGHIARRGDFTLIIHENRS